MNPIQIYGLILNQGEHQMSTNSRQETLIEQEVTYTLEINGNFFIIEIGRAHV